MTTKDRILEALQTPPYKFQVKGVRFIERLDGNALVGDEMGTGKTYQTIAWLALNPHIRPALIVCPAALKLNWQREFWKHAKMNSEVLESTQPCIPDGDIWIINYDILKHWQALLISTKPKVLVLDESHRCKNRAAQRTKAAIAIGRKCKRVLGLSGTPITNGPVEFFPILNLIAKKEFPSFTEYAFHYCDPKRGFRGRGWDFSGSSNLDELHERIKPFMIRRTKLEVLPELPIKTRTIIPIKLPKADWKEYETARDSLIEWLTERRGPEAAKRAKGAEALVKIAALKKITAMGKLKVIKEWISDFMGDLFDRKLVMFGVHRSVVRELCDAFAPSSVMVTGEVSLKKRQSAVDRFQEDPTCRLFFGNLRAAGEGITLTAADTAGVFELGWTPAEHEQAEDRILRIGQTSNKVEIFYFIAKNTIEEQIMETIEVKRDVIGQILDGKEIVKVQTRIINSLLKGKS